VHQQSKRVPLLRTTSLTSGLLAFHPTSTVVSSPGTVPTTNSDFLLTKRTCSMVVCMACTRLQDSSLLPNTPAALLLDCPSSCEAQQRRLARAGPSLLCCVQAWRPSLARKHQQTRDAAAWTLQLPMGEAVGLVWLWCSCVCWRCCSACCC